MAAYVITPIHTTYTTTYDGNGVGELAVKLYHIIGMYIEQL